MTARAKARFHIAGQPQQEGRLFVQRCEECGLLLEQNTAEAGMWEPGAVIQETYPRGQGRRLQDVGVRCSASDEQDEDQDVDAAATA